MVQELKNKNLKNISDCVSEYNNHLCRANSFFLDYLHGYLDWYGFKKRERSCYRFAITAFCDAMRLMGMDENFIQQWQNPVDDWRPHDGY